MPSSAARPPLLTRRFAALLAAQAGFGYAFSSFLMLPKFLVTELAAGLHFAIIVSRFNSFITDRLLGGAVDALERLGASSDSIDVVKVPGSLEIPVVANELGENGSYDAIICLGAVIRGDTPHFDYVAAESAIKGMARNNTGSALRPSSRTSMEKADANISTGRNT